MVTDMTHFDGIADLDPEKNRVLFRLVDQLGAITKAGCLAPAGQTVTTGIRCTKRLKGHRCPGYIAVHRTHVPLELRWQCGWCHDPGVIRGFQGTIWDIRPAEEKALEEPTAAVRLSPAEYEAVRRIASLDPEDERLVYRARYFGGLIELSGVADDLESLAGMTADEAGEESNARRRADLNAVFDRIHLELGLPPFDEGLPE